MAILETDSKIEQLETNSGITQLKEFKYSNNQNLFVPIGVPYHKIVTKSKSVIYQTLSKPQKHSEEILRVKNKTALPEAYNFLEIPKALQIDPTSININKNKWIEEWLNAS